MMTGCFQEENTPCPRAQITNWCLVLDNEFIVFNWPPQYPDLDTIEQLWDVVEHEIYITDVEPTNLQQLCDPAKHAKAEQELVR